MLFVIDGLRGGGRGGEIEVREAEKEEKKEKRQTEMKRRK